MTKQMTIVVIGGLRVNFKKMLRRLHISPQTESNQ